MYTKEELQLLENKILNMDCKEFLKNCPDGYFDLLLTDPPYGGGGVDKPFAQGDNRFGGRFTKYMTAPEIKVHRCGDAGGHWSKYEETDAERCDKWDYAPEQEVFDDMFRVSKNQIIWGGNYFNLPPTRCFNVWKKLTISEKFSMAMAEYCWTSFNKNAKVWEYAPQDPSRFHPTQKPLELIMKQIQEYTKEGDLILDCYSGSGTTAVACHKLNRRFICVELNPVYYNKSVKRLEEEKQQLYMF